MCTLSLSGSKVTMNIGCVIHHQPWTWIKCSVIASPLKIKIQIHTSTHLETIIKVKMNYIEQNLSCLSKSSGNSTQ